MFTGLLHAIRADPGLTVLVVKDVHWADEATLDLLRHTGRQFQGERALVLVSFRDEGPAMSVPLRQTLGELARQRTTRRVSLPPLSRAAVEQLVTGTPLDAREIHTLTGGDPFFVSEVLRGGGDRLPASARDAVLARAATLDAGAERALEAASLAGNRVDPALLEAVVGAPRSALDAVVATGLLVPDGHSLRFRHEIARLAVAEAVPEPRRAALHARILAALTSRGVQDDARLAFHAEGAGDSVAVVRHSEAAARRAAELGAHREAAAHLSRALTAGDHVDSRTRARLLDALATELGMLDRWRQGPNGTGRRPWFYGAPSMSRCASASRCECARGRCGASPAARTPVRRSTRPCTCSSPAGRAPSWPERWRKLAGTHMVNGEHEEALLVAERAEALAEQFGLPDVLSDVLDTRACSMLQLGQDWEPTMRRAIDVAVSSGCHEQAGRAYTNLYGSLVGAGEPPAGERVFLDGLTYCEDHEVTSFGNCLRATRVEALEATGRWSDASRLGWTQLDGATLSPNNRMHFALSLVRIAMRRGEVVPDGLLEDAVAACEGTGEPQWVVPARLLAGERAWLAGRLDEAHDAVAGALAAASATGTDGSLLGAAAVWARRLGLPHPDAAVAHEPWAGELRGDVTAAVARWQADLVPYEAALVLAWSPVCAHQVEAVRRLDALGASPVAAVASADGCGMPVCARFPAPREPRPVSTRRGSRPALRRSSSS